MTITPQVPNGCFLACFQSFVEDTQPQIFQRFIVEMLPGLCNKGTKDEAVVFENDMATFCAHFGIEFKKLDPEWVPLPGKNEAIFIGSWKWEGIANKHHVVRMADIIDSENFRIMNPSTSKIEDWNRTRLRDWDCSIYRLRYQTG